MGIPTPGVLAGTTSGTIITYDNSLELGSIAIALQEIAATLQLMYVLQQQSFGTAALAVPGSPAASLANLSTQVANLSDTMMAVQKAQGGVVAAVAELSNSTKAQAQAASRAETLHAMAVADQIETNRFQRAESEAALKRNGIEPQPQPPIMDTLKANLKQATEFSATADFATSAKNIASKALDALTDYIKNSALVTWGQTQLTELWKSLGLNKLTQAAANPKAVASDVAKTASATAARTGVWTPQVVPPQTWYD